MNKFPSRYQFLLGTACTAVAALQLFSLSANADPIVYGDIIGERTIYRAVTENSTTDPFPDDAPTDAIVGLYGTPEMLGDSLVFNVPTFAAVVESGPGIDLTDGFLTFELSAAGGTLMNELYVEELGTISLFSPATTGENLTNASIATPVFLDVREIVLEDGTDAGIPVTLSNPVTISSSLDVVLPENHGGLFGFDTDGFGEPEGSAVSWVMEGNVDLVAELLAARPELDDTYPIRGVQSLQFSMNNTMKVSAENGFATAYGDKKKISIQPGLIENVPEPTMPALLLLALCSYFRKRN